MDLFIGRKQELDSLNFLLKKSSASLVVIKGRRRIGKSRLIQEFGKKLKMYFFSGLPPTDKTTKQTQLDEFGWQLGHAFNEPAFKEESWNDLFLRLATRTRAGRVVIVLDEISWMGSKDSDFVGKLKNAWDLEFKKNPELILILCGSVSAWIEKNILSSTGFLGRVSLSLTLEPLSLVECNTFWGAQKNRISAYEKFKVLAVTGGIPKYLEEIQPSLSAEDNIKRLCFQSSGLLFNEFEHIFTDIFGKKSEVFKRILEVIREGYCDYQAICQQLKIEGSGVVSEYLDELVKSGFLKRDFTWHLLTGKASKLSHYRISDNYLRFYLRCIQPVKDKVLQGRFEDKSLATLPGWDTLMGLQFENLVLSNRALLLPLLNLKPDEIVSDNPFFQTKTARQEGCQIDYLIQTRMNSLYICEIKFSKSCIQPSVIHEVQQKIQRLKIPKNISYRPVLIHVNGVSPEVVDQQYFSHIIDLSQFF